MVKRVLSAAVAVSAALALSACGKSETSPDNQGGSEQGMVTLQGQYAEMFWVYVNRFEGQSQLCFYKAIVPKGVYERNSDTTLFAGYASSMSTNYLTLSSVQAAFDRRAKELQSSTYEQAVTLEAFRQAVNADISRQEWGMSTIESMQKFRNDKVGRHLDLVVRYSVKSGNKCPGKETVMKRLASSEISGRSDR